MTPSRAMIHRLAPLGLLLLLVWMVSLGSGCHAPRAASEGPEPGAYRADLHDALYAAYVDEKGRVDYAGLGDDPRFARLVASVRTADPDRLDPPDRLAYWINAYNTLVLEGVVRHYPVESVTEIRIFHGFFKRETFRAAGREVTLDDIEHGIIREEFDEPRIHFALVCAALSCPPLRREAYRGERLDAQLEDQARLFFADAALNRLDREKGVLYLSSILDWYGEDFADTEEGLVQAILPWLPESDAAWIRRHPDLDVRFLDYDWALNDRALDD